MGIRGDLMYLKWQIFIENYPYMAYVVLFAICFVCGRIIDKVNSIKKFHSIGKK